MLKNELKITQIYKHKWTCKKKKVDWFVNFNFQKPPMRCTKVLLPLNENKRTQNLSQIAIQIFEKLVNMS
jgi:hypothetical protein